MPQPWTRLLGVIGLAWCTASSAAPSVELSRLDDTRVRYAPLNGIERFPPPVIAWRRAGLASDASQMDAIIDRIVYPLIEDSEGPIAAIVIEYLSNTRESVGITVLWSDGTVREALIDLAPRLEEEAYKVFFKQPRP